MVFVAAKMSNSMYCSSLQYNAYQNFYISLMQLEHFTTKDLIAIDNSQNSSFNYRDSTSEPLVCSYTTEDYALIIFSMIIIELDYNVSIYMHDFVGLSQRSE